MKCIYSHDGGAYCDKHDHGAVTVGCCGEENCPDREVITNAERIRRMTDEELATALYAGCSGRECPEGMWGNPLSKDEEYSLCLKCTIAWLKSPVKDLEK